MNDLAFVIDDAGSVTNVIRLGSLPADALANRTIREMTAEDLELGVRVGWQLADGEWVAPVYPEADPEVA